MGVGGGQENNRWDRMNRYGSEPEENANECVWEGGRGVQEGWNYVLQLFFSAEIKSHQPWGCSGHTSLLSSPTGGGGIRLRRAQTLRSHSIAHLFHLLFIIFEAYSLQCCCHGLSSREKRTFSVKSPSRGSHIVRRSNNVLAAVQITDFN